MKELAQGFASWLKAKIKETWPYLVIAGLFWGLGFYMGTNQAGDHDHAHQKGSAASNKAPKKKVKWTCSMHPQFQLPKKGKCPICFMDLIPASTDSGSSKNPRKLKLTKVAKALAEISTTTAIRKPTYLEVKMVGRISIDETKIKHITAWIPGRLERTFVDYTGMRVRKGDHLVKLYSPELLAAQQELLQALRANRSTKGFAKKTAQVSLRSARQKLKLLGLHSWQLRKIERQKKALERINIYAPIGGIVTERKAIEGMYVKTGSPLYTIVDMSKLWVRFDAYERDLPLLRQGQHVHFTTQAAPGRVFSGKLTYIDPVVNAQTRTVGVRVNVDNQEGLLKPEMFVRGTIQVSLNAKGVARAPDLGGTWRCPMHPEIISKRKKGCPICGMSLERIRKEKKSDDRDPIVIPASAPLITGKRSVVYVKVPKAKQPSYEGRVVTLGPQAGRLFIVLKGIKEGEEIVTHGAFKLDSELQIRLRPSMMLPTASKKKKSKAKAKKKPKVPKFFLRKLSRVYADYFALSKALSSDDPKKVLTLYKKLAKRLRRTRAPKGEVQMIWEKLRSSLFEAVNQGAKRPDIKGQRKIFEKVSKGFIELERTIGHDGMRNYYLAYCSMAFNNRGAYWLQSKKKILNPYFGKQMLSCGSIKEALVGREGEPIPTYSRFVRKLSPLYQSYFQIQYTLFKDNEAGARKALAAFAKALQKRRSRYLPRKYRSRWKVIRATLDRGVKAATKSKGIAGLRVEFETLSKGLLQMVYIFGHQEKQSVFEAYCPMAFDYRGAAWLQNHDRRVHNSYFGKKMAYCGTIRRRFSPRSPEKKSRRKKRSRN